MRFKIRGIRNTLWNSKGFWGFSSPTVHGQILCLDGVIKSPGRKVFDLTDSSFSYFAACPKNQFHLQCKKRKKTTEETFYVQYWDSVPARYNRSIMVQWIHLNVTGLTDSLLFSTSTPDSTLFRTFCYEQWSLSLCKRRKWGWAKNLWDSQHCLSY